MELLPWRACWRRLAWPACENNCESPRSSAALYCWWSLLTWRGLGRRTVVALETKRREPPSNNRHLSPTKARLRGSTISFPTTAYSSRDGRKETLDRDARIERLYCTRQRVFQIETQCVGIRQKEWYNGVVGVRDSSWRVLSGGIETRWGDRLAVSTIVPLIYRVKSLTRAQLPPLSFYLKFISPWNIPCDGDWANNIRRY